MEQKQLTHQEAFGVIYQMTGQLALNRADAQVLDNSLRVLATLLPQEEVAAEEVKKGK